MKGKRLAGVLVLGSTLLLSNPAIAFDAKQDFETAYTDYQTLLNSTDTTSSDLVKAAYQAYETGRLYFGEDSMNTANLGINYLKSVGWNSQSAETLQAVGEVVLSVYEAEVEKTDARWLDAYVAAMSVPFSESKRRELRDEYLAFIEPLQQANPALYVVTLVDGVKIWHQHQFDLTKIIEPRLADLKAVLPPEDAGLLQLELYLAHQQFRKNNRDTAIEHYENVIANASPDTPESRRVKLLSHAALVELYERDGESERATEHCIAIGATQPWTPDAEPEPLFRINPGYPRDYALRGLTGSVKLKFDIDESGFVTNIRPVDSDKTPSRFVSSAEKSVSKWRYAPKFENGKPVIATDQTVQLDFNLEKGR